MIATAWHPSPPWSIGIIDLEAKISQIDEFKGLIRKILWNKDLGCQRALKMDLGQLPRPSRGTDASRAAPNLMDIVASDPQVGL